MRDYLVGELIEIAMDESEQAESRQQDQQTFNRFVRRNRPERVNESYQRDKCSSLNLANIHAKIPTRQFDVVLRRRASRCRVSFNE